MWIRRTLVWRRAAILKSRNRIWPMEAASSSVPLKLQTIERALSSQRFALIALQYPILFEWIALAGDQPMDRIRPQMVMIIEILVAQYQAMNALTDKFLNAVFDITLVSVVDETVGKIL